VNSSYKIPSDSPQRIIVDSKLIYAIWNTRAAYADCDAMFEVRTSFVGEGAQIQIIAKTENGKNLGKIDAQIFNNRLIASFPIPKNAPSDDLVFLEVRLPKHNLKGETNRIPIRPQITVERMQWSAKEARRGEVLTLTCVFQSPIPTDTEAIVIIYEYDQDGCHDVICKIPTTVRNNQINLQWEYEYHADTDEIPTKEELQRYGKNYNPPEYFFMVVLDGVRIGTRQESGLLRFKDFLDFYLYDYDDILLVNHDVEIDCADGSKIQSHSDDKGYVYIANVVPGPVKIHYKAIPRESLELKFAVNDCTMNETALLFSTDSSKSYNKHKKLGNQGVIQGDHVVIDFTGLEASLSYTLEIYNDKMVKIATVFENAPYGSWL
jgi:hypothetical protein